MLQPKKTKYRKMQKGRMKGHETRGVNFEFGSYALKALEPGWITSRQIEAARRAMTREIKRGGNVWIKIFPDKPITAKPAETRMGSGKGNLEYWVAVVKPNRILFELEYFDRATAVHALELAAQKLPIKVKVIEKNPVQQ
ncbi:MAG: 50S ribosomal protein L16 [Candidatus Melainabacteria bacterium]|nr:MAG: 50S ribosomal protein L16 [Candidatus Melainabacteria bacterium]